MLGHQSQYFHPQSDKKKKFSVKAEGYEWSKQFDITTFGLSGLASLKRSGRYKPEDPLITKYDSNNIDFGVLISTLSAPYSKTKAITFVPRYVIVNESGFDLIVAQDYKKIQKQHWVNNGSTFTYYFEHKKSKENAN